MPGFNIGTADRGSVPFLLQDRLIDDTYLLDEAMAIWHFEGIPGPFVGVNRTDVSDARTLGSTFCVPVDPGVANGENFGVAPGSQADQPYNSLSPRADFYLKRIVHRVFASRALQLNFRTPNDLSEWQRKTALRHIWSEYARMVCTGVGGGQSDREFLGLAALATGSQRIVGDPLDIPGSIDSGLSRLRPSSRPSVMSRAIIMNSVTRAIYVQQLRARGVEPGRVQHPILGECMAHGDMPIVMTNFIPEDSIPQPAAYATEIYLVVLGREHDGVYGTYQEGIGSNGVTFESGTLDLNRDAQFLEVAWHVGLALGSRSSLVAIALAGLVTPLALR